MRNWMSTPCAYSMMAMFAIVGTLLTPISNELPQTLDAAELQGVRGGADYFCCVSIIDPDGTNCDACLSNGNGMYVKCTSTASDNTHGPFFNQTPGQRWSFFETACGSSTAVTYNSSSCTGQPFSYGTCYRTYTMGARMPASGVNCSGY